MQRYLHAREHRWLVDSNYFNIVTEPWNLAAASNRVPVGILTRLGIILIYDCFVLGTRSATVAQSASFANRQVRALCKACVIQAVHHLEPQTCCAALHIFTDWGGCCYS